MSSPRVVLVEDDEMSAELVGFLVQRGAVAQLPF